MEFKISTQPIGKAETQIAVLFSFSDKVSPQEKQTDKVLEEVIKNVKGSKDFKGEKGETLLLYPTMNTERLLLIGLGKQSSANREALRDAVGAATQNLRRLSHTNVSILVPKIPRLATAEVAKTISETIVLASYEFGEFKSEKSKFTKLETLTLIVDGKDQAKAKRAITTGQLLAEATNLARDLGNHPANTATPSHLAKHALDLSKQQKDLKVQVLNKTQIKKEKMGALLGVAQGSEEEPKFIVLEYQKKKTAPKVVLVGKGVTFDSGGISIKPSERMEEMKNDMAGAAAVLGIMKAASELQLPLNLVGLIPATENLPSGRSIKPGDVVTSRNGKTIEVINTDAEGRLILSDALDYAKKYKPDLVIDFATLTGAMVVALGFELIGAFSTDKKLHASMQKASENTGEKTWPMPLEDNYRQLMKSDAADLRNISTTPYGGAITAALFLQNFVDFPWIHMDIAGPAWSNSPKSHRPKGATGSGVRLAIDFLLNYKK